MLSSNETINSGAMALLDSVSDYVLRIATVNSL